MDKLAIEEIRGVLSRKIAHSPVLLSKAGSRARTVGEEEKQELLRRANRR
jgi:hypothetical protein